MENTFTFDTGSPRFHAFVQKIENSFLTCNQKQLILLADQKMRREQRDAEWREYAEKHPVRYFFYKNFLLDIPDDLKPTIGELIDIADRVIQVHEDQQNLHELNEFVNDVRSDQVTVTRETLNLIRKYTND